MDAKEVRVSFLESQEPRKVFSEIISLRLDFDLMTELFDLSCEGHSFIDGPIQKLAERMFNILVRNKVSETNKAIVQARKRTWNPKEDASARKATKLQSQSYT